MQHLTFLLCPVCYALFQCLWHTRMLKSLPLTEGLFTANGNASCTSAFWLLLPNPPCTATVSVLLLLCQNTTDPPNVRSLTIESR